MSQAIVTKFLNPTNTKGARISAKAAVGKVTVNYDHGLSDAGNHAKAAKALAEKFGWGGHWVAGGMPNEDGDVFVLVAGEKAERFGPAELPSFSPDFTTFMPEA